MNHRWLSRHTMLMVLYGFFVLSLFTLSAVVDASPPPDAHDALVVSEAITQERSIVGLELPSAVERPLRRVVWWMQHGAAPGEPAQTLCAPATPPRPSLSAAATALPH